MFLFFGSFDIESCERCNCDRLKIGNFHYHLFRHSTTYCGGHSYNFLYGYLFSVDWSEGFFKKIQGSTAYIRFVSDDTGNYKGFNLSFIAGSSTGKE